MVRSLGSSGAPSTPPAARAAAAGWRDPRLWIGIALVALCVVAGVRLFAAADDTVEVWSVSADMGAGDQVGSEDLVARRVQFADGDDLDRYFLVSDELPTDLQLVRGVGAGELLPRGAVGTGADATTVQLSIEVESGQLPTSVAAGSVVDVWLLDGTGNGTDDVTGKSKTDGGRDDREDGGDLAAPVLPDVTVVDLPAVEESFGSGGIGTRAVVLAVDEDDVAAFYTALDGTSSPTLSIVRHAQ